MVSNIQKIISMTTTSNLRKLKKDYEEQLTLYIEPGTEDSRHTIEILDAIDEELKRRAGKMVISHA